jgi:uncharacterized membrane protein
MFGLPPIPSWDALHPLIVHFPIALLMAAPLFIVAGLIRKRWMGGMVVSALILMALGTAAAYVAVPSGEAAGKLAERTPQVNAVLERHESLGETTRTVFTILTLIFGVLALGQRRLRRLDRLPGVGLQIAYLALYAAGLAVLANTAHDGGRLVHEFGVRAFMPAAESAPPGDDSPGLVSEHAHGTRHQHHEAELD